MTGTTRRTFLTLTTSALACLAGSAASADARPPGWTEASHGDEVPPDAVFAFPTDRVLSMEIVVVPDDWAAMLADLDETYAPSAPSATASLPQATARAPRPAPPCRAS